MIDTTSIERHILFLVHHSQTEMSVSQVMKLIYLADADHTRSYRERLLDLSWEWHRSDPYSQEIYVAIESLTQHRPAPVVPLQMLEFISLQSRDRNIHSNDEIPPHSRRTLVRTLDRYGQLTAANLNDVIRQTKPLFDVTLDTPLTVKATANRVHTEAFSDLQALVQRAPLPDTRSWGDPDESAAEDECIMRAYSALRGQANRQPEP